MRSTAARTIHIGPVLGQSRDRYPLACVVIRCNQVAVFHLSSALSPYLAVVFVAFGGVVSMLRFPLRFFFFLLVNGDGRLIRPRTKKSVAVVRRAVPLSLGSKRCYRF